MSPHPRLAFSVASLEDEVPIHCRLYAPYTTGNPILKYAPHTRLAIVAHPYAPLGGSQDDPIVHLIVRQLLKYGYFAVTFDFRGAGQSSARTSWTGKAERSDFASVLGISLLVMVELDALFRQSRLEPLIPDTEPVDSLTAKQGPPEIRRSHNAVFEDTVESSLAHIDLVLAGYSYGSIIASSLPPVSTIVETFTNRPGGSTAGNICRQAALLANTLYHDMTHCLRHHNSLAHVTVADFRSAQPSKMKVYEGENGNGRMTEHKERVSSDSMRKSVERSSGRFHFWSRTKRSCERSPDIDSGGDESDTRTSILPLLLPTISTSFLLVSPVLPPLASLLTGFTYRASVVQKNLQNHSTLAVFGINDGFTSHGRYQRWASDLQKDPHSGFHAVAVDGAGHFWREAGVQTKLEGALADWIGRLNSGREEE